MSNTQSEKILITLRKEYVAALDTIVERGAARSRSALIEQIISGFLRDLDPNQSANKQSALDGLAQFFLGVLGGAAVTALLSSLFGKK
ncbi:MAG: ribbon-helix-helix domain-containing protein [Candidatus Ranarchaeia archaeon]